MSDEQLTALLEDLLGVLHLQAEEIQRLVSHVEGQTTRIPHANQLPLILSELSELHQRVKKLSGAHTAT